MSEILTEQQAIFSDMQKQVIFALKTQGGINVHGFTPERYQTGLPVFFNADTMKVDGAIDFLPDCGIKNGTRKLSLRGSSLCVLRAVDSRGRSFRQVIPAFIQAGNYIIIYSELYHKIPKGLSYSQSFVPLSEMHSAFGFYPHNVAGAIVSAVISDLDLSGKRVVEFGSALGHQLVVAAKSGAEYGIGIDIPLLVSGNLHILGKNLSLMGCPDFERFRLLGQDILEYGGDESHYIIEFWRKSFGDIPLPDTAIINMGVSYDFLSGCEVMRPHLIALHQAIALGVQRVIVGGLSLRYYLNGKEISPDQKPDMYESDRMARELLVKTFSNVYAYTAPNGFQCIVGEGLY